MAAGEAKTEINMALVKALNELIEEGEAYSTDSARRSYAKKDAVAAIVRLLKTEAPAQTFGERLAAFESHLASEFARAREFTLENLSIKKEFEQYVAKVKAFFAKYETEFITGVLLKTAELLRNESAKSKASGDALELIELTINKLNLELTKPQLERELESLVISVSDKDKSTSEIVKLKAEINIKGAHLSMVRLTINKLGLEIGLRQATAAKLDPARLEKLSLEIKKKEEEIREVQAGLLSSMEGVKAPVTTTLSAGHTARAAAGAGSGTAAGR